MKENKISTKIFVFCWVCFFWKTENILIISTDNLLYTDAPEIIATNTIYNGKISILTFM